MNKLKFTGKGGSIFGIMIVNFILTVVTFGLYYPWAKEKMRKYLWNETSFKENRFQFHGTGKEMFRGFVKVYLFVIAFYISIFASQYFGSAIVAYAMVLAYIFFLVLIPFAIFGAWRYRTSRTSWRGIRFSFDGNRSEFVKLFLKELFFTIISFGIYGFWMQINIRKYIINHTKIGDRRLSYEGNGTEFFGLNVLGGLLSVITFYIYLPAFLKNIFNFHVNNTKIENKSVKSTLTNSEMYGTVIVNILLIIFTVGLAFPWVYIRSMKMYLNNIELPEDVDYDNIKQNVDDYFDATGDELVDFMDFDL